MKESSIRTFWARDNESAHRAKESQRRKDINTFSGVDVIDGKVKSFSGVVVAVEDFSGRSPDGRRWRVSIRDKEPAN